MTLPESFVQYTRNLMGDRLFSNYLSALDEPSPVSIRINPFKCSSDAFDTSVMQKVAWCPYGYYLDKRPDFTFDPCCMQAFIMCKRHRVCSFVRC